MPRYDERSGPTRLYVGHISSRTRTRDLEELFSKYGRVRDVDMKYDFAFVDFYDSRDADDARHYLNGRNIDGSRIAVEFAKRGPRGAGGVREYVGRGPAPGTGRCYNCGHDGHWARDCKAGDWKNKCYRCGQRGHIERDCHNSPSRRNRSASRSRSRSPVAARRRSRSRTYSRSPRKERSLSPHPEQKRRMVSRSQSASPQQDDEKRLRSPATNGQNRRGKMGNDAMQSASQSPRSLSRSPERSLSRSPRGSASPSRRGRASPSPRRSASPSARRRASRSPRRSASPSPRRRASPSPRRSASPSPRRSASPSPRRSVSPNLRRSASPSPHRQIRSASPSPHRQSTSQSPPMGGVEIPDDESPARNGYNSPSHSGQSPVQSGD